jgi:hypothetical protein
MLPPELGLPAGAAAPDDVLCAYAPWPAPTAASSVAINSFFMMSSVMEFKACDAGVSGGRDRLRYPA